MKLFVYEDVTAIAGTIEQCSTVPASLLAEGRAMLDAVTADALAIPGVEVLSLQHPDQFESLARLADWSLVIAPETDRRLELLCRQVLAMGGRLLGPSPDAIAITSDKLSLARIWEQRGVPTPRTWAVADVPGEWNKFIIKPRDGCGSQATRFSDSPPTPWEGELIAQEYVLGTPASVAFLVGPHDIVPLIPCEQLISDDGTFQYRGGKAPLDSSLQEQATETALAAIKPIVGLFGYVGVDLVVAKDRAWAIEINPRLTTSYIGLRAMTTNNLVAAMLDVATGQRPQISWLAGARQWDTTGPQIISAAEQ